MSETLSPHSVEENEDKTLITACKGYFNNKAFRLNMN